MPEPSGPEFKILNYTAQLVVHCVQQNNRWIPNLHHVLLPETNNIDRPTKHSRLLTKLTNPSTERKVG